MGEIDRKDQEEGACPKCGYCKACGRGGMMPYYTFPIYPVYPYIDSSNPWRYEVGPYSTNTGGSSISTTSSVISWR